MIVCQDIILQAYVERIASVNSNYKNAGQINFF